MIKIENVEVFGWESAIRGMRNPLNSWDKSDSFWSCCDDLNCNTRCDNCDVMKNNLCIGKGAYKIGPNDLKLMQSLVKAGTDHSKFMRMINVTMDITAPMYWAKEMDTYKVSTVRNSCSTMHKIHSKEFTLDDFSHEHLGDKEKQILLTTIEAMNESRDAFVTWNENYKHDKKDYWWQMIQLLPSSYNQKFTWQANYQVLRNIYFARRNHKLDEWVEFCKIIETLPYAKELITLEV